MSSGQKPWNKPFPQPAEDEPSGNQAPNWDGDETLDGNQLQQALSFQETMAAPPSDVQKHDLLKKDGWNAIIENPPSPSREMASIDIHKLQQMRVKPEEGDPFGETLPVGSIERPKALDELIQETIVHTVRDDELPNISAKPLEFVETVLEPPLAHTLEGSPPKAEHVLAETHLSDGPKTVLAERSPVPEPEPTETQKSLHLNDSLRATARQTGGARRYQDGLYASSSGEVYEGDSSTFNSVIELPYRSHEVIQRFGNYDILAKLGEGAMGIVYKAYSVSLCRMCAIKVLKLNDQVTEAGIVRFQNEAMLAARLRHPNIVSVFDSGEQDGQFFFVMEYVKGQAFTELIKEQSEDSVWRGVRILTKVARALEYAHQFGIVHRDLKPDNIMVDENDEPYITDFGIAKGMDLDLNLTQAESVMGTPYYMSPEQANGELKSVGPQSDVYALGATLYHLLTHSPPFQGDSLYHLIFQLLNKEPISPKMRASKDLNRTIPDDIETICLKCLEKEVARRYSSAAELADDLQAFLDDRPISARPIGSMERMQKLLRRNRSAFVGVALTLSVLFLMAVSFGAVLMYNMEQQSNSLRRLDRKSAIDQASTLERAVRSNMLEGRADIVRALVGKLRKDKAIASIEVVRPDRTLAYTDLRTRSLVEKRLSNPKVMSWITKKYPKLLNKIGELKRVAFKNMEDSPHKDQPKFKGFSKVWNLAALQGRVQTRITRENNEPMLTVLWPIRNTNECRACHGESKASNLYGGKGQNFVRAVLVVKRSQRHVEWQISANRWATLGIGAATSMIVLFFLLAFGKLFGVGLQKRQFGQNEGGDVG